MQDLPSILLLICILGLAAYAAILVYRSGKAGGNKKKSLHPPPAGEGAAGKAVRETARSPGSRAAGGAQAGQGPAPAEAPSGDILARGRALLAAGLFQDAVRELEKIPKSQWGEEECSLALRAFLRLNSFSHAKNIFEWAELQAGLRDSPLLQYLYAIICERAGDVKRASAIYDKLLRLNGSYQDCEARLRRLRRLPAEDALAVSAYFETTGRGSPGRGPGSKPRSVTPVLGEVAGRFSMLSLLGIGGSGAVFLAKDKALNRLVALKRLSPSVSCNAEDRALFLEEAKTLSELRHPRIVEFYEAVEFKEDLYLVLEYVDWETLQTVMALRGRLTPGEVVPILAAVAEALAFAHEKKVIHRDLKPGNIVAGPKGFVKVMDFGIARHFDPDASDIQEVEVVGTPPYMAPEQHAGVTTPLSDIYSFGVLAYTLLTGSLPFAGPTSLYYSQKMEGDYPRLPASLPSRLRELIDSCLMFDPGKRPPDAASLLRLLSEGDGGRGD
ncbi:MAG: serine/threonine-protein kinase [Elusimicrobiota bacterium]|nr:serine/threonine-protein kinase [Elusimicrobiota bacterium]